MTIVQADEQLYVAEVLREHREHLESIIDELRVRGTPLSALEARLIVHNANARLIEIEHRLRVDAESRPSKRKHVPQFRRLLSRIRGLTKPRIGRLRHYPPRPLQVPATYMRTTPPSPAPTISLVTPSFQQGCFLARTLHSVLSQHYPALEYFVQDGGSTDETIEILRRYDGQLSGWTSEPDDGQGDAINRAFSRTAGELMGWLNSDDIQLPGALAYVAHYMATHPEVDVVYGNRILIDENDGQIGLWVLPRHDDRALTLADFIPQETLFWRRSIWEAVGGRVDPAFGYALDWDLLLRFREAGATMVHLPRFLGAFRVHEEQKTSAQDTLGARECAELRARTHGGPMSLEEVVTELKPYLRRHVLAHTWRRSLDRMPQQRIRLTTLPVEPRSPTPAHTSPDASSANDAALPVTESSDTTRATNPTPARQ